MLDKKQKQWVGRVSETLGIAEKDENAAAQLRYQKSFNLLQARLKKALTLDQDGELRGKVTKAGEFASKGMYIDADLAMDIAAEHATSLLSASSKPLPVGGGDGGTAPLVGKPLPNKYKNEQFQKDEHGNVMHGGEFRGAGKDRTRYFDADQKDASTLRKDDQGRLIDRDGNLVQGKGGFVVSKDDGTLHTFDNSNTVKETRDGKNLWDHHSSPISGGDAAAGGDIDVEDGVVREISDQSGHYRPTGEMTHQFVDRLEQQGVKMRDDSLTMIGPDGKGVPVTNNVKKLWDDVQKYESDRQQSDSTAPYDPAMLKKKQRLQDLGVGASNRDAKVEVFDPRVLVTPEEFATVAGNFGKVEKLVQSKIGRIPDRRFANPAKVIASVEAVNDWIAVLSRMNSALGGAGVDESVTRIKQTREQYMQTGGNAEAIRVKQETNAKIAKMRGSKPTVANDAISSSSDNNSSSKGDSSSDVGWSSSEDEESVSAEDEDSVLDGKNKKLIAKMQRMSGDDPQQEQKRLTELVAKLGGDDKLMQLGVADPSGMTLDEKLEFLTKLTSRKGKGGGSTDSTVEEDGSSSSEEGSSSGEESSSSDEDGSSSDRSKSSDESLASEDEEQQNAPNSGGNSSPLRREPSEPNLSKYSMPSNFGDQDASLRSESESSESEEQEKEKAPNSGGNSSQLRREPSEPNLSKYSMPSNFGDRDESLRSESESSESEEQEKEKAPNSGGNSSQLRREPSEPNLSKYSMPSNFGDRDESLRSESESSESEEQEKEKAPNSGGNSSQLRREPSEPNLSKYSMPSNFGDRDESLRSESESSESEEQEKEKAPNSGGNSSQLRREPSEPNLSKYSMPSNLGDRDESLASENESSEDENSESETEKSESEESETENTGSEESGDVKEENPQQQHVDQRAVPREPPKVDLRKVKATPVQTRDPRQAEYDSLGGDQALLEKLLPAWKKRNQVALDKLLDFNKRQKTAVGVEKEQLAAAIKTLSAEMNKNDGMPSLIQLAKKSASEKFAQLV